MDEGELAYGGRTRRSLHWLLTVYVGVSALGMATAAALSAWSQSFAVTAAFLVPTIAGVLLINRAFYEGRFTERAPRDDAGPSR